MNSHRTSSRVVSPLLGALVSFATVGAACSPVSRPSEAGSVASTEGNVSSRSSVERVKFGGVFGVGKTEALLVRNDSVPLRGAIVMSPGAKVPAMAMMGLATRFSKEGYVVYVVDYFLQLPILPTESGKATALARALSTEAAKVEGLPKSILSAHQAGLPVSMFGYSLGAAVIADAGKEGESYGLKSIVLFGLSQLIKTPTVFSVPVTVLRGEKDGLVSDKENDVVESSFNRKQSLKVSGVNHFCIVDDPKAGDSKKRAEDLALGGGTSLSAGQCQDAVVQATLGAL
jgi:dienelactone hydrolase